MSNAEDTVAKVALIDLDGTVADYHASCIRGLKSILAPGEAFVDPWSIPREERPEWLDNRRDLVSNQPGFWRDLAPIADGMNVMHLMRKVGFSLMVLTKGPVRKAAAWTEKVEWCRIHLPSDIGWTVTTDKQLTYGRVLFDDYPDYVEPWLKHRPRGLVLMLDQPWNRNFKHPQAVRVPRPFYGAPPGGYCEVEEALRAAFDR